MLISSLPQFPGVVNAGGGNRQSRAPQPGGQRGADASTLTPTVVNKAPSVEVARDDAKVERVNLNLIRESTISLQSQRAVATYNAAANAGGYGVVVSGALDLFA